MKEIYARKFSYQASQEGRFFRVQQKAFAGTGQKNRGIREEIPRKDFIRGRVRGNFSQPISDEKFDFEKLI